jgi:hypothetical protein
MNRATESRSSCHRNCTITVGQLFFQHARITNTYRFRMYTVKRLYLSEALSHVLLARAFKLQTRNVQHKVGFESYEVQKSDCTARQEERPQNLPSTTMNAPSSLHMSDGTHIGKTGSLHTFSPEMLPPEMIMCHKFSMLLKGSTKLNLQTFQQAHPLSVLREVARVNNQHSFMSQSSSP